MRVSMRFIFNFFVVSLQCTGLLMAVSGPAEFHARVAMHETFFEVEINEPSTVPSLLA
jgi:hypothetical protein